MLDLTKINKKSVESKNQGASIGVVTIITSRDHIASGLSTQMRMNGGIEVKRVESSFQAIMDGKLVPNSDYFIIDIESGRDVHAIEQKIKFLFPVTAKKLFVGDVDSISFCDEMKRIGAVYLHIESQMMMIGNALKQVNEGAEDIDYTQKISVIGCKGGSGTSLIAWELYRAIGELSNLPTLLIQGHTGTPDLDLISDTPLARDGGITQVNAYQSMKISTDEEQWQFDSPDYRSYNVVIFDHNLISQVRDKLAFIVPGSDFVFIVVTRELASVRNARLIIDEFERASPNQDSSANISKNIIILNENHISKPDELSNEDIEDYLGKKIDIYHGYIKNIKKSQTKNQLYEFAAKMLGRNNASDEGGKGKNKLSLSKFFKKK